MGGREAETIRCPKCGVENSAKRQGCWKCGTMLLPEPPAPPPSQSCSQQPELIHCEACGHLISGMAASCPQCGHPVTDSRRGWAMAAHEGPREVANTSGTRGFIPEEVKGWNWGAFWLTWIWGVSHQVWVSLIALVGIIPYAGWPVALVMSFVLGVKGNEWAWQNRRFQNVAHFREVQRIWAYWGWGLTLAVIGVVIGFVVATRPRLIGVVGHQLRSDGVIVQVRQSRPEVVRIPHYVVVEPPLPPSPATSVFAAVSAGK